MQLLISGCVRRYLPVLLTLVGAFAIAEPGVSDNAIVIGMSAPFHGAYASTGQDMRRAIRSSFDAVNAEGGVFGRKLELDSIDDDGEVARAVMNTRTLLDDHHVFALMGYYGDASVNAVEPLLNDAKTPLIGMVSGSATLRNPVHHLLFHVHAGYNEEIATMVAQLMSLKLTRIAVFYQNDAPGKANADNFSRALDQYQLAPAAVATVEAHDAFSSEVNVASAVKLFTQIRPQAIILLTQYKAAGELVLQLKKNGVYPQYLALSTVGSDELYQLLGTSGRGIGITQVLPYPWDDTVAMVKEYQRRMAIDDKSPIFSYSSFEGYVMGKVLIDALKKAGKDLTREKLISTLEHMNVNLGGYRIAYSPTNHNGSTLVELTVTGPNGKLLR